MSVLKMKKALQHGGVGRVVVELVVVVVGLTEPVLCVMVDRVVPPAHCLIAGRMASTGREGIVVWVGLTTVHSAMVVQPSVWSVPRVMMRGVYMVGGGVATSQDQNLEQIFFVTYLDHQT